MDIYKCIQTHVQIVTGRTGKLGARMRHCVVTCYVIVQVVDMLHDNVKRLRARQLCSAILGMKSLFFQSLLVTTSAMTG